MRLNLGKPVWKWEVNPIIVKELRSRMRGVRAFATLTGTLLLIGGVSYGLYRMVLVTSRYSSTPLSPQVGGTLFAGLALLELIMVCGVTPSVTAGEISGEQEKQTYEMLLATPLRPASILWGKLVSSLSYVFILIFAAIPMASLVFIYGGVSLRDMVKALIVLVSVAVMLGALGLFMSALFKRTGRATALTYLIVILLLLGPLFVASAVGILGSRTPPRWILVPSPISALTSAIQPSTGMEGPASLLYLLGGSMWGVMSTPVSQTGIPRPIYHYSLPFYGGLSLLFYLVAARLVQPTRRWRITWKGALVTVGLLAGYSGLVAGAFLLSADRYERGGLFNAGVVAAPQPAVVERVVRAVPVVPIEEPDQIPPTPTPAEPPDAEFTIQEQAQIYTAVIGELASGLDALSSSQGSIAILQIVSVTSDQVGDPSAPPGEVGAISPELQSEIETALGAESLEVNWLEAAEDGSPYLDSAIPADKSPVLVLGKLHSDEDHKLQVSAVAYLGGSASFGATYLLDNSSGAWEVRGMSEEQ
jgi:ABC-2 type transport system permease protein